MSPKDKLDDIMENTPIKWQSRKIQNIPDIVEYLTELYPNYSLTNKVIFYRNNLVSEPRCALCNGILANPNKNTCSRKCRDLLKHKTGAYTMASNKAKETCLKKYGVSNPAKLPEIQKKRIDTMLEMHGGKVSERARESSRSRAHVLNSKGKQTLVKKYNVTNPGMLPSHREKCVSTLYKNYGVDHYFKSDEYVKTRDAIRKTKWEMFSPEGITVLNTHRASNQKKDAFENPNDVVSFKCKCGKKDSAPTETFKWRIQHVGTPCVTCGNINSGSLKEHTLANIIGDLGVTIIRNDRTIISPKELDIVIPDRKIAIEFCGLYWHNDLRIDKNYHKNKQTLCSEKGYRLITIFEDEWDNNKDVVISRIKNAIGLAPKGVFARNCVVEEITLAESREFLTAHHLQGNANSSIKLGLKHKGKLLSVMTFSKPSVSKGHQNNKTGWELLRFCSSVNVVGGANKLFSYFIKTYNPQSVLSFCDLRWGTGQVYKNLGFRFVHDTSPGYWYVKGSSRIHRYSLRKNIEDDQVLTEYENRLKQGYLRIWDCGHTKYVWSPAR